MHARNSDIRQTIYTVSDLGRDASHPAIVMPHGGPTGQTVDYFNTDAAALASREYVVIAPNPRGSAGYGIEFQKANIKDLGGVIFRTKFVPLISWSRLVTSTQRRSALPGARMGGL